MTTPKPHTNLNKKHPDPPQTTDTHTNWQKQANCLGQTHLMFPQHHKDITYIQKARELCNNCKVQTQCLNYALEFPPADMHGVWAGYTSRQLAAEQKRRGIKATRQTLAKTWGDTQ